MSKKQQYRIGNWRCYNRSLVNRGDLTIWFDEESLEKWHDNSSNGKRGRPKYYSNAAIVCVLTIKCLFNLPLRAAQGFSASIIKLLKLAINAPDYTTLSRRQKNVKIPNFSNLRGPVHLVFDSTGLKVFGDGEWKVRQHGISKRRVWRKLHMAIDEKTGVILSSLLSTNDISDSEVLPDLIEQIDIPLKQASGDGAYDSHTIYELFEDMGVKVTIPPRENAKESSRRKMAPHTSMRDKNIYVIKVLGRKRWKEWSGYHRRSIAETTMMRFKGIFGDKLSAIDINNQATEAFIKCSILNKMILMGKPESYAI
jgi:hypothetical protein